MRPASLPEDLRYGSVTSTNPDTVVKTRRAGLEPATFGLEIRCSVRLSYRRFPLGLREQKHKRPSTRRQEARMSGGFDLAGNA